VNSSGKVMQQVSTAGSTYTWNISSLIAGAYFIRVQTADVKEFNFKIVKE
jgi:hypothetical protein